MPGTSPGMTEKSIGKHGPMPIAANRRFHFSWPLTLACLVVLGILIGLGTWQVERMQDKRAMIAERAQRLAAPPLNLPAVIPIPDALEFRRVQAQGRFLHDQELYLGNRLRNGQAGYHVVTPLLRADGSAVMVDRGWVPLGADRSQRPDVAVGGEPRAVTGRLDGLPVPGLRLGEARAPDSAGWPLVLNFPVTADLEAALGEPVEARILLLDADQPDGYERAWRPSMGFPPERHLGYAIQWLALALVVLVAFVATGLQPRNPDTDRPT